MKRVLIALKRRQEAAHLAAVAAAIAEPDDEIEVLHVFEPGLHDDAACAVTLVEGAVDLLHARGFVASGATTPLTGGNVARRLAERVRSAGADLVVLGSRGLGHVGGLFGRSVSHALMAATDVPVLVVPAIAHLPLHGFGRVLVALREEAEARAMARAIELIPTPAEVLALHVPRPVAVHVGGGPGETYTELPETSDIVLRTAALRLREAGVRAEVRRPAHGTDVARAISDAATEWDADLLVLGSRRLRDWEAVLAGSTCHNVIRLSHRAVLVAGRVTPWAED
jgi:nucleotide-binding universal stress UspA family protein